MPYLLSWYPGNVLEKRCHTGLGGRNKIWSWSTFEETFALQVQLKLTEKTPVVVNFLFKEAWTRFEGAWRISLVRSYCRCCRSNSCYQTSRVSHVSAKNIAENMLSCLAVWFWIWVVKFVCHRRWQTDHLPNTLWKCLLFSKPFSWVTFQMVGPNKPSAGWGYKATPC